MYFMCDPVLSLQDFIKKYIYFINFKIWFSGTVLCLKISVEYASAYNTSEDTNEMK